MANIQNRDLEQSLLGELINYSNDMVFIMNMQSMRFEYINQTASDELGYSFDEMQSLGVEGFRKSLPDKCTFSEHLQELQKSGKGMTDYAILVKKDGSEIYIEARVRIINRNNQDYNIAIIRDINERVRLVEELKRKSVQIQHYLDIAQVLIMVLDNKKNVVMINQEGANILGYTKEEIVGKNWMDNFLPKNVVAEVDKVGENILNKKTTLGGHENPVLTKSGEERLLLWKNTVLLDDNGNSIGILTSGEDITDKREHERQMMLHTKQAQMGEMISMIAHQWRQPLGAIAATVCSLQFKQSFDDYNKEYYDEQLENISKYTQHLSTTIDDFREFFKEDKEKKLVKINDIVESSLEIIRAILTSRGIEVKTEYLSDEEVLTYPNEMKQVMLNILKNAQEVIDDRKVKNPLIQITTYTQNEKLIITVKDNAGGIEQKYIDKIFDPYFTTKGSINGTGLGLYMSKTIIHEHCNGSLDVQNGDGGAIFKITL